MRIEINEASNGWTVYSIDGTIMVFTDSKKMLEYVVFKLNLSEKDVPF